MVHLGIKLTERSHLVVLANELEGLHAEPELSAVVNWIGPNSGVHLAPGNAAKKRNVAVRDYSAILTINSWKETVVIS